MNRDYAGILLEHPSAHLDDARQRGARRAVDPQDRQLRLLRRAEDPAMTTEVIDHRLTAFVMASSLVLLVSPAGERPQDPARPPARGPVRDQGGPAPRPGSTMEQFAPHGPAQDGHALVPTDEEERTLAPDPADPRRALRPAGHGRLPRRQAAPDDRPGADRPGRPAWSGS